MMSRALFRALLIVVAAAIAIVILIRTPFGDYLIRRSTAELTVGAHPVNILVIANNARGVAANQPLGLGSAAGQADVMMILHIDPLQRGVWAITIPRDALVAQPHWNDPVPKIKTLFFMGNQESPPRGPHLTMQAVSALVGLPIDGYVAMNFAGFKDAVDFFGGLDVNVRSRLYDPQNSGADFSPGTHHMNGAQVLAFVRIRQNQAGNDYRTDDYQRMSAEVQVLSLLRAKLLDPKNVGLVLPRFVAYMRPDIATDLNQEQMVRLGIAISGVPVTEVSLDRIDDSMNLTSASITGVNTQNFLYAASYDVLDPRAVCRRLSQFGAHNCSDGLPPPHPPASVDVRVYGSSAFIERLHKSGYMHVLRAGPGTGESLVIYPQSDPGTGWAIARLFKGGGATVTPSSSNSEVIVRE
jgi:LCP family protein required for cell wall assembly